MVVNRFKLQTVMKTIRDLEALTGGLFCVALLAVAPSPAFAHCDGLDGPVVKAARTALEQTNVNLVLPWVKKDDGTEIKRAFEKTLAVRHLNAAARDLADMYFFETLVRTHRAGEGAPYTGLQPAGRDLGPALRAADKAVEDGQLEPVARLLTGAVQDELHKRFEQLQARKHYPKGDVQAGRQYVQTYIEFVHYVEGVHRAASGEASEHAHEEAPPATHQHE